MHRVLIALVMAVALTACQSANPTSLQHDIARLDVATGQSREVAVDRLQRGGFRCDPDGPGALTCTRMRGYYLVSTCVHRVNLTLDAAGRSVVAVKMVDPVCAGL